MQVHNLILTRNLIGKSDEQNSEKKLIQEIPVPSACEEAFEDACDSLLPVRAHGLMELISLLGKGDQETLAKIDKILCLFQVCIRCGYLSNVKAIFSIRIYSM